MVFKIGEHGWVSGHFKMPLELKGQHTNTSYNNINVYVCLVTHLTASSVVISSLSCVGCSATSMLGLCLMWSFRVGTLQCPELVSVNLI